MSRKGGLIVFAREPRIGHVKTRLAASIGAAGAFEIYTKLLTRTLRLAEQSVLFEHYLFCENVLQVEYFKGLLNAELWTVRVQSSGDLGQRMRDAFASVLQMHNYAVLIGSDVADFELSDIDRASADLETRKHHSVLGPTADGGYWLIGLASAEETLFESIPWSTDTVAPITLSRMSELGLSITRLELRHDVDEFCDLKYLRHV
ncbi:MAG: rSAM/selenodomain-associated transferase 1 [Gammaproteobacteria bacterium]